MNRKASGVVQCRATVVESPITAMTTSSSCASPIVCRNVGSVSKRFVSGSMSDGSWCSQPAWFSSLPWWWSTVNRTVSRSRAAAPR
jgi:hypothetical protein